ncbi:MAG: deoxyribonuclease IV [Candidatus Poribacteria bacterium]
MGSDLEETQPRERDELGAHVSSAGGVQYAPARAEDIEAAVLQLFTKQPSRWAEPDISLETREAFQSERKRARITSAVVHDSYLINLSSPDPALWERSLRCFTGEVGRAASLGLDFVVSHPGNATDGDLTSGIARNADGVERALTEVKEGPMVLLELTAGSGTSVGGTFENLAAITARLGPGVLPRVGFCFDTCHAYAGGYDLVRDYDGVFQRFGDVLGLDRLRLFHVNDSKGDLGSKRDRHEHIGRGTLGEDPFRRLMRDERFTGVPKILETPKEDDPVVADLANLNLLRSFRE